MFPAFAKTSRSLLKRPTRNILSNRNCQHTFNASLSSLSDILSSVKNGTMSPSEAEELISSNNAATESADDTLRYFANLDHTRSFRAGFPEVVFAETKTPRQVAMILDDMARHVNKLLEDKSSDTKLPETTAILATR